MRLKESYVRRLIACRNQYRHPAAHISFTDKRPHRYLWGEKYAIEYSPGPEFRFSNSMAVDRHHFRLLNAATPHEVVLGLASAIYWGNYLGPNGKGNATRARIRTEWFLDGRPGREAPLDVETTFATVQQAREEMAAGQSGQAVFTLSGIRELGQLTLSSKVAAFLNPYVAAVFDRRIATVLQTDAARAHLLANPSAGGITGPKQKRYAAWCDECARLAHQVNHGIMAGKPWHWTDWNDLPREWRPTDIERAYAVGGSALEAPELQ